MVAAAAAMRTSLQGHDENEKITRAMQGARATLQRLTRQLRTAKSVSFTQSTESGTYDGQSVTMDVTTLSIDSENGLFMLPITQKPTFYGYLNSVLDQNGATGDANRAGPISNIMDYRFG